MHAKACWITSHFLLRAVIYFPFHNWSFMLTLNLCVPALAWGGFHIGNFLLSSAVSLKKASLLVHPINMPEYWLGKAWVTFSMAYPCSLKTVTEKYGIHLIPLFQGTSLKKKYNKGLLWEFTGPSYLLRSRLLKQESHLTVYQCSISHNRPLTLLGVLGRRQQHSAAGTAIKPLISCLKLP